MSESDPREPLHVFISPWRRWRQIAEARQITIECLLEENARLRSELARLNAERKTTLVTVTDGTLGGVQLPAGEYIVRANVETNMATIETLGGRIVVRALPVEFKTATPKPPEPPNEVASGWHKTWGKVPS